MHNRAFTVWTNALGSSVFTDRSGDSAGIQGMQILFRVVVPIAARQPSLIIPFAGVPAIYRPERRDGPRD